jgi:hypothetical protein
MKKLVSTLLAALLHAGALAVPASAQEPAKKVLNWVAPGEVTTMDSGKSYDAISSEEISFFAEPLYRVDQNNEEIPALAVELPTVSEDGLTVKVKIRDNAGYSNGLKIVAADVVYAAQRVVDPATGSQSANELTYLKNAAEIIEGKLPVEDLGIKAPEADWKNRKYLTVADWPEAAKHRDRFGAGVLKFVKEAAAKGLYTILIYAESAPQWSRRFQEGGDYYLGYDCGEIFTFRLEERHLAGQDPERITLKTLTDSFMQRVREHVERRRATGWGHVMATSIDFYIDYEIAAGADVPLMEDFAFSHLNMASSLSRGLYRQFDLPIWGSHLPMSITHGFRIAAHTSSTCSRRRCTRSTWPGAKSLSTRAATGFFRRNCVPTRRCSRLRESNWETFREPIRNLSRLMSRRRGRLTTKSTTIRRSRGATGR